MGENGSLRKQTTDIIVDIPAILYVIITLQVIAIILASVGNGLLIYLFIRQWRRVRRNVTVYFILNLAICDFLKATVQQPLRLLDITLPDSVLHQTRAYCRVTGYFTAFIAAVSFHSIVAIGIDRYFLICHPLKAKTTLTLGRAKKVLGLIWLFALCVMVPLPALFTYVITLEVSGEYDMNTTFCLIDIVSDDVASKIYFYILFSIYYMLPLIIITMVYSRIFYVLNKGLSFQGTSNAGTKKMLRSRKSLAKIMLCVAVVFVVCESPYFITFFIVCLGYKIERNPVLVLLIIELLPLICSVLNPIIYSSHSFCNRKRFLSSLMGNTQSESTFERRETFRSDVTLPSSGKGTPTRNQPPVKVHWSHDKFEECEPMAVSL